MERRSEENNLHHSCEAATLNVHIVGPTFENGRLDQRRNGLQLASNVRKQPTFKA